MIDFHESICYTPFMTQSVLSTFKIKKKKAFDEPIDVDWIDWAIEMIEAGFESEHLYILAGETEPFNQFYLRDLTDKVLRDLGMQIEDKEQVIKNYVYYLITSSIDHPDKYLKVLREIRNISIDLDLNTVYMDFSLLYYAKQDLLSDEVQWYWPDANRQNIDQVIKTRFHQWIVDFNSNSLTTDA